MYCNEKEKLYKAKWGDNSKNDRERESPLRKDMLYREDSRGISRIWRRRRAGIGQLTTFSKQVWEYSWRAGKMRFDARVHLETIFFCKLNIYCL